MRIIPARAGVTTPLRPATAAGTDHPRSRGVYADRVAYLMVDMGSSPLARGLRDDGDVTFEVAGIIPARAGFTWQSAPPLSLPPDHPRSRGVYHTALAA